MDVRRAVLDDRESKASLSYSICVCNRRVCLNVLNTILEKWVEPPWNDSVTLTRELRLTTTCYLESWTFVAVFGFFCYLTLSSLYWHTTVGVGFLFCHFFCLFVFFCPHRNLMAQELTNKKLVYNKVDCNQQLPGVTQWTKKSKII